MSSVTFLGLVMNLCLHVDYAEASSVEVNHHPTSERDCVSYLLLVGIFMTSMIGVVLTFIFCLIGWFKYVEGVTQRRRVFHFRECLATGTWGNNLKYLRKKRNPLIEVKNIHDETNIKKGCFDDWRMLRHKNKIPVVKKKEVKSVEKSERGVRTSGKGIILFGAARDLFPDSVQKLDISESKQNESDEKERMDLVVVKRETISNLEGKSKLNDDNGTEVTDTVSLDISLDAFSVKESVGCRKEWSIVLNNTRYIGSERPKGNSSFIVTDEIKDDYATNNETKKERNRRLLLQHQESYKRPVKGRKFKYTNNSLRHEKILREIKEEDAIDDKHQNKLELSLGTQANMSDKEERNSEDILRQIKQILNRKVKISKKKKRQFQNKIKNITPPVNRIKFVYLSEALRIFMNVIRLYSSSAFRYAMFRSNRRYKPGD